MSEASSSTWDRGAVGGWGALPAGERVVLVVKPSMWFIVLSRLGVLGVIVGVGVVWNVLSDYGPMVLPRSTIFSVTALALTGVLAWRALEWQARVYLLTDRRMARVSGVIRQTVIEVPIEKVQSVALHRSVRERLTGLGSVGVTSAGSQGIEVGWYMVAEPGEALARVRSAIESARRGGEDGAKGAAGRGTTGAST